MTAVPLAFLLRFDWAFPANFFDSYAVALIPLIFIKIIILFYFRPFTTTWRQISYYDAKRIFLTTTFSSFVWIFLIFTFFQGIIPRSIPILDFGLSTTLLFFIRLLRRYLYELKLSLFVNPQKLYGNKHKTRTMIIGAGQAGSMLLREIRKHPEQGIQPVVILDDDLSKVGQRLLDIPIKGTVDEIAKWVQQKEVDEVIFAVANENGSLHRRAIRLTSEIDRPLRFRTIPAMVDLISGDVQVDRIREVNVEDLLGRASVELEEDKIVDLIRGKTVLITGAGGSIGSELVRQSAKFSPMRVVLLGRGENSLYLIEREMLEKFPEIEIIVKLCDIQNMPRLTQVFDETQPDIVLHAAAHKHVPIIESNPTEAVFNNILGTRNLTEVALNSGVLNFVNISTDKAVNPTSVMGASKHIAESIVHQKSEGFFGNYYVSVRFGNVLGSRGSVIPLFKKQIRAGGPVTVTHPDMVRYFMTIPEAARLVLQAAALGKQGKIYVLDMGEPVKIYELAKDLIRLSGFKLDQDIKIEFSGIRPGEKLFEELSMVSEHRIRTRHSKIYEVSKVSLNDLNGLISELEVFALQGDESKIYEILNRNILGAMLKLQS